MKLTNDQRERISKESVGKVINEMKYEPEEEYWVISFKDGSEISVRLMVELDN